MTTWRPSVGDWLLLALVILIVAVGFSQCPAEAYAQEAYATGARSNVAVWFMGVLCLATLAGLVVFAVVRVVRWVRRNHQPSTPPPREVKPQCPACRKPADDLSYPLPRLAVPRRVTNLGQWSLISPEDAEDQTCKVCAPCFEVALTLARVERERLMEQRAGDRRKEMERLAEFQRRLPDEVKRIRYPEPPEVKP